MLKEGKGELKRKWDLKEDEEDSQEVDISVMPNFNAKTAAQNPDGQPPLD